MQWHTFHRWSEVRLSESGTLKGMMMAHVADIHYCRFCIQIQRAEIKSLTANSHYQIQFLYIPENSFSNLSSNTKTVVVHLTTAWPSLWPFDLRLRVNACWMTAMHCMSDKFGVNISRYFSFRAMVTETDIYTDTHKVTDTADHRTHASAIWWDG